MTNDIETTQDQAQLNGEYWVRAFLVPDLNAKIGKLIKRAAKLGCEAPVFEITPERENRVVAWKDSPEERCGVAVYAEYVKVIVRGNAPKFNGWRLVARLLHDTQTGAGSATIINAVPGQTVPTEFRSSGCKCDHCGKNWIVRKDTYVVANDSGEYKQVGSNCLADFLGHVDPQMLASLASFYTTSISNINFDGEDFNDEPHGLYVRGATMLSLSSLLSLCASYTRIYGWTTSAEAKQREKTSSLSYVISAIFGKSDDDRKLRREIMPTESDKATATAAIEWAKVIEAGDNDFLYNLSAIAKSGTASNRTMGIAAAMLGAHKRFIEGEIERKARPISNWVGTVGERTVLELYCVFTRPMPEGMFGPTTLHRFVDEVGNDFTWFASGGEARFELKEPITVKATIKNHGEFKGRKQTVLSRVVEIANDEQKAKLAAMLPAAETLLASWGHGLEFVMKPTIEALPADEQTPAMEQLSSLGLITLEDDGAALWTLDDAAVRLQQFAKARISKSAKKAAKLAKVSTAI